SGFLNLNPPSSWKFPGVITIGPRSVVKYSPLNAKPCLTSITSPSGTSGQSADISRFHQQGGICSDLLRKVLRLDCQRLKNFTQLSEPLGEVEAVIVSVGHTDIPARIEAPPVALNLLDGRHLAQPGNVDVDEVGEPL